MFGLHIIYMAENNIFLLISLMLFMRKLIVEQAYHKDLF